MSDAVVQLRLERLAGALSRRTQSFERSASRDEATSHIPVLDLDKLSDGLLRAPGSRIESHLNFVADAALVHATDRFDYKLDLLLDTVSNWAPKCDIGAYPSILRAASDWLSAARDLVAWLLNAPDVKMRKYVLEGLRDSETPGADQVAPRSIEQPML